MATSNHNSCRNYFSVTSICAVIVVLISWFLIQYCKEISDQQVHVSSKYWGVCLDEWNENGNLRTMNRVFERLGYDMVNGSNDDNWDVLWSIEYPFMEAADDDDEEMKEIKNSVFYSVYQDLKPHQRINHIPGISYVVCKDFMTTQNKDLEFILPSFILPGMIDDCKAHVAANPTKKFVVKNIDNRGVEIAADVDEIQFDTESKIYQEFMDRPFLIDDHAFDLGIFVLISSIDPLRIYRFDEEILLRFCPEPYHPFDPENRGKYVVDETHQHFSEMPSLSKYSKNFEVSSKMALEAHLSQLGHDVANLWDKIDEAIVDLLLINEQFFVEEVNSQFSK